MNFFRVQHKGHSLQEMKRHETFIDVDPETGEDITGKGVCASLEPDGADGGQMFGGAWDAMDDDDELIIFKGQIIKEIYDGYVVKPLEEIARFTIAEWAEKIDDGSAWDYEN